MKIKNKIFSDTFNLLLIIAKNLTSDGLALSEAFLLSGGSSKKLAKLSNLELKKYNSTIQSLKRYGYIKKVNENQFLITPKGISKIRIETIKNDEWDSTKWDGNWKLIAFDIPEDKKRERNILRSLIKRKGFIGIQNSVFIAPVADFEQLALLRKDLKIEKYVSFFTAKSYETDDDSALRKRFKLR